MFGKRRGKTDTGEDTGSRCPGFCHSGLLFRPQRPTETIHGQDVFPRKIRLHEIKYPKVKMIFGRELRKQWKQKR